MDINGSIYDYDNFVFFSPHLDDVVLSCGSLLLQLKKYRKQMTIITVFTKVTQLPYSPQAREFIKACGYDNAQDLFVARKNEDEKAMIYLNAKYKHWDYIDAAWRKDDKNNFVYSSSQSQFSGRLAKEDIQLKEKLVTKIGSYTKTKKDNTLYIGPLGIGGHADHVLVREALIKLNAPTLYWEDYPYNVWQGNKKILARQEFKKVFNISLWNKEKTKIIKIYKSQIPALFPDKTIPQQHENYYRIL